MDRFLEKLSLYIYICMYVCCMCFASHNAQVALKHSSWGIVYQSHSPDGICWKQNDRCPSFHPVATQSEHLESHLGLFFGSFLMYFWWSLRSGSCYSHEHVSTCSVGFVHILYGLGTLLGDYFSNTFATLMMFSRGWFICLGLSESRLYICGSQPFNTCSLGFPWTGLGHSSILRI